MIGPDQAVCFPPGYDVTVQNIFNKPLNSNVYADPTGQNTLSFPMVDGLQRFGVTGMFDN